VWQTQDLRVFPAMPDSRVSADDSQGIAAER
jgi:hypothetical protein